MVQLGNLVKATAYFNVSDLRELLPWQGSRYLVSGWVGETATGHPIAGLVERVDLAPFLFPLDTTQPAE